MSDSEKKKHNPAPASKEHKKRDKADQQKDNDSSDVGRAVYDGMQDLRVKKPR